MKVPTLFIFFAKDHVIAPETVGIIRAIVDAPYSELRIPSAAHWVQQEASAEVSAALLKFLNE